MRQHIGSIVQPSRIRLFGSLWTIGRYWRFLNLGGLSSPVYVCTCGNETEDNHWPCLGTHLALIVSSLDWLFYVEINLSPRKQTRTTPGRARSITTLGYIPFFFINLSLSFGKSLAEREAESYNGNSFHFLSPVHITAF
ncbi:hypothetical protein ACQKWADRAFT_228341 [Trichoderma austrokoningii]